MKQFLCLMILCTISLFKSEAQFIDTTTVWNVAFCSSGPFSVSCETFSYKFSGDTTISGINYSKLYKRLDSISTIWGFDHAIRDSGNKIFFHTNNGDKLLYDFGANVGDTIKQLGPFFNQPMVVDSVDTIMIGGMPKKRLIFGLNLWPYPYEIWVEDIGSLYGIVSYLSLYDDLVPDYGEVTLCYWKNGQLLYIDPDQNTCYLNTTGINEINPGNIISVFPNPADDEINFVFPEAVGNVNIEIYDVFGRLIYFTKDLPAESVNISIDFPAGLYFYNLITETKQYKGKFIKK